MEIPIVRDGRIMLLSRLSPVIDVIRGYLNIFRVYTTKENRERVEKACEKLFGSQSLSSSISA